MITVAVREESWLWDAFKRVFGRPSAPVEPDGPTRRVYRRRSTPVPAVLEAHSLDVARLSEEQREALVSYIVERSGYEPARVRADLLGRLGCPIPVDDVALAWEEQA